MRIVCITYSSSNDVRSPEEWLDRIKIFIGSWEKLAKIHEIIRIDQIAYSGLHKFNGIDYRFIQTKGRKTYLPWGLHRMLRKLSPDIVMVSGLHYPFQVIQLRLLLPAHVRIIAQHHAEKPFKGIRKFLQFLADRFIDAYFFSSLELGQRWVKNGNLSDANKIHEVMEVSSIFQPLDKRTARLTTSVDGEPVYLWVGRLDDNKDPILVVKSFLRFCALQHSARLYMIYQTEDLLPEIRQLLSGKDKEKIILIGKLPHEDLQFWYSGADFIISASHYEGSGTAVCEAMSCGCVPILTNIESFRAMTSLGQCGWLYEEGNEEALLESLNKSIQEDYAAQRVKTLQQFRQKLSFEAIAKKIQTIIESLTNGI
ncbi:MAG: glycosyltransferase family 4 protein [Chitinophagales bacterium]